MVIQFALQDALIFLLCILGITVALLIIPVLMNTKKVMGILRDTLVKNQESIQKTIRSLPGILENVGQVTNNSKEITNQLRISVPVIAKEIEGVTHAAKDGIASAGVVLEKMGTGINDTVSSYKETSESAPEEATGLMVYVPLIKDVLQIIEHNFSEK